MHIRSHFIQACLRRLCFFTLIIAAGVSWADNWPEWRGPGGSGVTTEKDLPTRWSAKENVRWKVALPEPGNSTPIVWNDRVFITQALKAEERRLVICFDRSTGQQLWSSGITFKDAEDTHDANPYASASPATDGERVIAWFGSAGVVSYDFNGKELWRRDLGKQTHGWGYAASPVIYRDWCYLNFGPGPRSFLVALDKKTGQTVWQMDLPPVQPPQRTDGFAGQRDGEIGSWSTPIIARSFNRDELVVSLPEKLSAFDPKTGKELWFARGLNPLIYTSPIYGDGVIIAMGGFLGTTIAVKPGGTDDVTETRRLWQTPRTKNRLGSGVISGGHVYILNTEGIAECLELNSGQQIWQERLKGTGPRGESWSSMVLAGDKIYILNQSSETFVLRASPTFEVIAVNPLDGELTNASLTVSNGDLFIRTHQHLWCIRATKTKTTARK